MYSTGIYTCYDKLTTVAFPPEPLSMLCDSPETPFPETKTTSTAVYVAPPTKISPRLAWLVTVTIDTNNVAERNTTTKRITA